MVNRKIVLNMVLAKLGGLKLDQFSDRLALQKRIYLLQVFGLDLGYRYSWYVRGPYCSSLTDQAYSVRQDQQNVVEASKSLKLSSAAQKILQSYLEFEQKLSQRDISRSLELAASIHFLKHIGFVPGGVTKANIKKILQGKGKDFSDSEISLAWTALDKSGLIERKEL
jgi:uncharacterized protein YwgA